MMELALEDAVAEFNAAGWNLDQKYRLVVVCGGCYEEVSDAGATRH